jgi:hypothetical protein
MTSHPAQTRADRAIARGRVVRLAAVVAVVAIAASCSSASSSGSAPVSSASPTPTTLPAVGAEQLVPGLLDADVLGVPTDWAIRDFDASLLQNAEVDADTDPFLGLLRCADGTIREEAEVVWVARTYTAPEVPLENGLLSIDIIVEAETLADWTRDRDALDDCSVSAQAEVNVSATRLTMHAQATPSTPASSAAGGSREVEAATLQLLASPTAEVPYPSAFNATTINVDDRTITVVLGGVDMGQSFQPVADEIALTSAGRLHSTRPPT